MVEDPDMRVAVLGTGMVGRALAARQFIDRHPDLIREHADLLLKISTFELQNCQRVFNDTHHQLVKTQREWEFRFNSQHLVTRRFVQLSYLNILKAIRHPGKAWRKLRWWYTLKFSKLDR